MRYQVTVVDSHGGFVCGATLNCPDEAQAERRFGELPLPPGEAVLQAGGRIVARRRVAAPQLRRTGS